jgi:hypothetical protein
MGTLPWFQFQPCEDLIHVTYPDCQSWSSCSIMARSNLTNRGGPSACARLITVYSDFESEVPKHTVSILPRQHLPLSIQTSDSVADIPINDGLLGAILSTEDGDSTTGALPLLLLDDGVTGKPDGFLGLDHELDAEEELYEPWFPAAAPDMVALRAGTATLDDMVSWSTKAKLGCRDANRG